MIHLPAARHIENEAGSFILRIEQEDGWVTVDRSLILHWATIEPAAWPQLRALLLEESDAANRSILMK
jgi:hypothetical protein